MCRWLSLLVLNIARHALCFVTLMSHLSRGHQLMVPGSTFFGAATCSVQWRVGRP